MGDKQTTPQSRQREIAKLTLSIEPEALKAVIEQGRLLEFASAAASEAAAQISSQIVDSVAAMAIGGGSGGGASAAFIFDGGDFGTIPPRPKFIVAELDRVGRAAVLQQFAAAAGQG